MLLILEQCPDNPAEYLNLALPSALHDTGLETDLALACHRQPAVADITQSFAQFLIVF